MKPTSAPPTAVLQALFVTFLWATSWVLIKIGLDEIPALTFAGLRYSLAFLILAVPVLLTGRVQHLKRISRRTWAQLIVLGLLFYSVTQGALFLGLAYLPAVTVNLILSLTSLIVALFGIPLLGELPTRRQWLGIGIALLGAFLYFHPVEIPRGQGIGFAAALAGLFANSGSSILGREINRQEDLEPLLVTVVSMGVGGILLLLTGVVVQGFPSFGLTSWAIIGWLALVNTAFAFTLWNHTLRSLSAMESSIINNSLAIQIPILAVVFLGETIDVKGTIGIGMVVLGTLLVQLRRRNVVEKSDNG
jgi:drug/metabolite transporter (DMT)-like permease